MESRIICPTVTGFKALQQLSVLCSFLWLSNMPLNGYAMFYLYIHRVMAITFLLYSCKNYLQLYNPVWPLQEKAHELTVFNLHLALSDRSLLPSNPPQQSRD